MRESRSSGGLVSFLGYGSEDAGLWLTEDEDAGGGLPGFGEDERGGVFGTAEAGE